MIEGIAYAILEKIGAYLVAPIGRQFGYVCRYSNIIQNLRDEVADLENMRAGEQIRINRAINNAEEINPVAVTWLTNAEQMKTQSDKILEDAANVWCLNLKTRYLVSRRATKKTRDVVKHQGKGKFDWVSCPAAPPAVNSTLGPTCFELRTSTTNQIMEALKESEINMIGICGMGGVGKTTMANEVSARTKAEKIFEAATMAVVSQTPDISKIQGEVGGMLGLSLPEGIGIRARAAILCKRLTNGQKILVILDDVWEAIDLGKIGIPAAGDSKGCKVLVTSRVERVCIDMGTQKNFTVQVLSKEEAWDLFKEEAKIGADTSPDLHFIAKEVAKECCGLPMAIVTVAKALSNRQMHAWNDSLRQLRNSTVTNIPGMHEKVYSSIELSYNYLESEQAKSLILLCCMFPDDYIIQTEKLFCYGVGLRLFEDVETLEAIRERVESLVDILISYHLLLDEGEDSDGNRCVKMHDVVRDVGIFIASREENVYKVTHDTGLKEWLQNDRHERYTAICFMAHDMLELPAGLHFPKLKLLQVELAEYRQGPPPPAILRDSSTEMEQLQVICVQGMCIKFLAPPLNFWRNLRTLYLDRCQLGNDISFIGSLKNLEILSFFQSNLDGLPSEIVQLGNLKLLDLRCQSGPTIIPSCVLLSLRKLEELYMGSYFLLANVDERNQGNYASISEINFLSHLKILQISIPPGPEFLLKLKNFHFENLKRFSFDMYGRPQSFSYQLSNSLLLNEVDMLVVRESNVNVLARTTEVLFLRGLRDLKNVLKYIDEMGCVNLKDLSIYKCDEVEYVIDTDDSVPGVAFINLESLYIYEMYHLIEICRGILPSGFFKRLQKAELTSLPAMRHLWRDPIQPPSLGNLRDLLICDCNAIKSVFPQSAVKCLVQLQTLDIAMCEMLEEVISTEVGEDKNDKIEFPKLKQLKLGDRYGGLPKLRSFYPGFDNGTIQTLFNQQVVLPRMELLVVNSLKDMVQIMDSQIQAGFENLRDMYVFFNKKLLNIATSDQIMLLQNLQTLHVKCCKSLEAVFDFEGLKVREEHTQVLFSQLYRMNLDTLPELTYIWRMAPKEIKGLQNLRFLGVNRCPKLRYLLSHVMAEMLVKLEYITVEDCDMVEEIVSKQEEVEKMDTIVFPQLHTLILNGLNNIAAFSSWNHGFEFPSLERLVIKNCHNMNFFCPGPLGTPKLERVEVNDEQRALIGDLNNFMQHLELRYSLIQTNF